MTHRTLMLGILLAVGQTVAAAEPAKPRTLKLPETPFRYADVELPVERGDTNADGVLDMEELKRLSERSERAPGQGPRGPNPNTPPPPRRPGN